MGVLGTKPGPVRSDEGILRADRLGAAATPAGGRGHSGIRQGGTRTPERESLKPKSSEK